MLRSSSSSSAAEKSLPATESVSAMPVIDAVRQIGQKVGLWSVQPGKGDAKLLVEFRSGTITGVRFAPEGTRVPFVYGTSSKDVVLISDFQ